MNNFVRGKRRLNGSFGEVDVNGVPWGEVTGLEVKLTIEHADVYRGLHMDKKMTGLSGEGTIKAIKAYSRSAELLDVYQQGKEPNIRITAAVTDPDAEGGQVERIAISNIVFEEIDILSFDHGELMEPEYGFTFCVDDLVYLDRVQAPSM